MKQVSEEKLMQVNGGLFAYPNMFGNVGPTINRAKQTYNNTKPYRDAFSDAAGKNKFWQNVGSAAKYLYQTR